MRAALYALPLLACAPSGCTHDAGARDERRSERSSPSTKAKARDAPPEAPSPPPLVVPEPQQLDRDPFGDGPCRSGQSVAIFHSPRRPTSGGVLRIIAVSEEPLDASLVARGPDGRAVRLVADSRGGPPWSWSGSVAEPAVGDWRIGVVSGDTVAACRGVRVRPRAGGLGGTGTAWTAERGWDRASENLYSAWIERLFDAPVDTRPRWTPLHTVTRDPARNFLWGHLGLAEDDAANPKALVLSADCADTPYFLRAYFAWKMRLPFQYSICEVPPGELSPRCHDPFTNDSPREKPLELDAMNSFLRRLADTVHSGSTRTLPDDDATDVYPLALTRDALRPGTLFADPHGHVLVLVSWQPPRDGGSGLLLAIDGHPDKHVGRKKFWRGTFGFLRGTWAGAPGFKAFRPITLEEGHVRALTNAEIRGNRAYGSYSGEQHGLRVDDFYARIERLATPTPVAPARAFEETVTAFHDLLRDRVDSIAEGERWMREHESPTIGMPPGVEIFATEAGPWEDYSTPGRDLQLLIAMDVVRKLPDEIERHPDRFALPAGASPTAIAAELRTRLERETRARTIEYVRSDGSTQHLTMADVFSRAQSFETGYNPNDCVEIRWGAADGSAEQSTCRRRSPAGQVQRMALYRRWFARRQRPPRI